MFGVVGLSTFTVPDVVAVGNLLAPPTGAASVLASLSSDANHMQPSQVVCDTSDEGLPCTPMAAGHLYQVGVGMSQPLVESSADQRAQSRLPLRAAIGGSVGTFVEFYNFSIYGFMALIIAGQFFPNQDSATALLSTLLVLASAWLFKPLGALLFGYLGDRYGRKPALLTAVIAMGASSFVIGLLPTYATLGVWATLPLLLIRLIQGLSAGGEIAGSVTLISESVPAERRGFFGAFTPLGSILGFAAGASIVGLLNQLVSAEAMNDWGWRIPFLTSLPITLLCVWVRRGIVETLDVAGKGQRRTRTPVLQVFKGEKEALARTFGLSVATNATVYIGLSYISIHLIERLGYSPSAVYWISAVVIAITGLSMLVAGALGDRIGLRAVISVGFIAFALLTVPAMIGMSVGLQVAAICYLVVLFPTVFVQAGVFAYVPRLFTAETRFTGTAVGWNLGDILAGGTAPYIAVWLVTTTDNNLSPGLFVVAASIIGLVALMPFSSSRSTHRNPSSDSEQGYGGRRKEEIK